MTKKLGNSKFIDPNVLKQNSYDTVYKLYLLSKDVLLQSVEIVTCYLGKIFLP